MSWWKIERRPKSKEFRGVGLLYLVFAIISTFFCTIDSRPPYLAFIAAGWWFATLLMFWRSRREAAKEKTQA
jgi:hypothetical protein